MMLIMISITNHYWLEVLLKKNYKYYESRGDKGQKTLSVKEYLYTIMPHLTDLINDQKNNGDGSNESKIQFNMGVSFVSS